MEMAEADDLSKFKFDPTGDVLVDYYLHAKIAGSFHDIDGSYRRFFSDADVCSATPDKLVAGHMPAPCTGAVDGRVWYFFSTLRYVGASEKRRSRTVDGTGGKEYWHSEGRPKPVAGTGDGQVQRFSYRVRTAPGVIEKPGWIMMEYSFKGAGRGDTVLCKVSRSRLAKKATEASSSAAATSGRKRKAMDDGEHLEEEAAPPPSARARQQTDEVEEDQDGMLFAGSLEHVAERQLGEAQHETGATGGVSEQLIQTLETILMTDDNDDAYAVQVPDGEDPCEFHERLLFGDDEQRHGEPEPQLAPSLREMETFLMTDDDDDDAIAVQVPDGEEPIAFYTRRLFGDDEQQLGAVLQRHGDAAVQTVHGPLSESDVISYLAAGFTVGELLDGSAMSLC